MNRWTYNSNVLVQILYFSKLDKYENIESTADQRDIMEKLKHILMSKMAIHYSNKCAKIKQVTIDYTSDKDIFLQLNLDVTIGTREEFQAEQNLETMGEIKFKRR